MNWLQPISAESQSGNLMLHLMPAGTGMVKAACGRLYNRDFAISSHGLRKCINCERRKSTAPAPSA